jgi:hypothetical protein
MYIPYYIHIHRYTLYTAFVVRDLLSTPSSSMYNVHIHNIYTTVTVRLACARNSPHTRVRELNNKEIVAAAAAAASAARFYWVTAVCVCVSTPFRID